MKNPGLGGLNKNLHRRLTCPYQTRYTSTPHDSGGNKIYDIKKGTSNLSVEDIVYSRNVITEYNSSGFYSLGIWN